MVIKGLTNSTFILYDIVVLLIFEGMYLTTHATIQ